MKVHRGESLTSLVRNSALSTSTSTMTKDAALVNIIQNFNSLEKGVEEISKPCLYNCSNLTINYNPTCK